MTDEPRHLIAACGLVLDLAGRVLLVKNDRGWEMPGGQVERGEDPFSALQREVKEEAGCEILPKRLFGVYSNVTSSLLVLAFQCSYVAGLVRGGAECVDAQWFEPSDALLAATHLPARVRIEDGLKGSDAVVFRSYRRVADNKYETVMERSG